MDVESLITMLAKDARTANNARAQLAANPQETTAPLITALGSNSLSIRLSAKRLLVHFGESSVMPLIDAMGNPNYLVREYSADALGDLGDARAYPALEKALNDSSPDVVKSARTALEMLKRKGVKRLDAHSETDLEEVEPLFPIKTQPVYAEPPPAPREGSLHPLNPAHLISVFAWVFFDPKGLAALDAQGKREARRVMALPVAFILWLPLLIPLIGLDLGVWTSGFDAGLMFLINIGAVLGFVLFVLMGWFSPILNPAYLQSTKWGHAFLIMLFVASVLGVSYLNVIFMIGIFNNYGAGAGSAVMLSMMVAVLIAAAVGLSVSLYEVVFPLFVIGGVVMYLIISVIGWIVISIWFLVLFLIPGAMLFYISKWLLLDAKADAVGGSIRRMLAGLLLPVSNIVLIWVVLLDGWWVIMGRPEIVP